MNVICKQVYFLYSDISKLERNEKQMDMVMVYLTAVVIRLKWQQGKTKILSHYSLRYRRDSNQAPKKCRSELLPLACFNIREHHYFLFTCLSIPPPVETIKMHLSSLCYIIMLLHWCPFAGDDESVQTGLPHEATLVRFTWNKILTT
jgi:hypothetical protein